MDLILIVLRGQDGRMRECLDWLRYQPNRQMRGIDVDGDGRHRCHLVLGDRAIEEALHVGD